MDKNLKNRAEELGLIPLERIIDFFEKDPDKIPSILRKDYNQRFVNELDFTITVNRKDQPILPDKFQNFVSPQSESILPIQYNLQTDVMLESLEKQKKRFGCWY